jgi:hypothetical protein
MTVPSGPVVFNNDTGSDSAASGLGPDTVVAGTVDVTSASSTLTNAVASSGSLSDVGVGDLIYITTSSGRKFSIVQGTNTGLGEFYTDDNWDVTETANWYVGGKRETLDNADSRRIFYDDLPAYTGVAGGYAEIEIQNTGTPYYLTSTLTVGLSGRMAPRVYGDTGNVELSWNSNYTGFGIRRITILENLRLSNTNTSMSVNTQAVSKSASSSSVVLHNVVLDETNNWYRGLGFVAGAAGDVMATNCDFSHCVDYGCSYGGTHRFYNCKFTNNGSHGVYEASEIHFNSCIFSDNGGYGFYWVGNPGYGPSFNNCIFYNNTLGGLYDRSTYSPVDSLVCGCIFHSNGGYAIDRYTSDEASKLTIHKNNAFYNSTTANYRPSAIDRGGITLSADPFVDVANADYRINKTIGGGAVLRSAKALWRG